MHSRRFNHLVKCFSVACLMSLLYQGRHLLSVQMMGKHTNSYSDVEGNNVDPKPVLQSQKAATQQSVSSQFTTDQIQSTRLRRIDNYCQHLNLSQKNNDIKDYMDANINSLRSLENTMLFDENHKVILRSIPKTGCSSWRLTFLNNSVTGPLQVQKQTEESIHVPSFMIRYNLKAFSQLKAPEALYRLEHYPAIITVRHPLDRMESAYVDKFTKPNIYNYIKNRHSSKILSLYRGQTLKNADPKEIQFDEFLRYLVEFPQSDIHWRNVWDQAHPCVLKYHYVAKQETMTVDLQTVTDRYLSGKHTSMKLKSWRGSGTQAQGKLLPLFSKLQDPEAWIQKLLVFFGHDMDMFGYSYKIVDGKVYAMCKTYADDMCV